jgi:hypothetical protein
MVMQNRLTYDQHLDSIIEKNGSNDPDFNRIEMIIEIYGGELKDAYHELLEARDNLNKIAGQFKEDYKSGKYNGQHYLPKYVSAQNEIVEKGKALRGEIARLARSA